MRKLKVTTALILGLICYGNALAVDKENPKSIKRLD
jgi:hypothetical protein